jgi:Fe-S-cluster containining protein
MYFAIDGFIDMLTDYARDAKQPVDCQKGCEWCCHQPVFALQHEMDYLNYYLENHFDEVRKQMIAEKAEKKKQALGFLNEKELLNAKFPCPLLENGACIAYQARPMACRIYLSSDVKSCLRFFHQPTDTESIPNLLEIPLRAGRMMNEGFKAALKLYGYETKEFRIEERLLTGIL